MTTNLTDPITSACQPYDVGPERPEPVRLWAVIDRLSDREVRELAAAFAVHDPRWFEDKLCRLWAERS